MQNKANPGYAGRDVARAAGDEGANAQNKANYPKRGTEAVSGRAGRPSPGPRPSGLAPVGGDYAKQTQFRKESQVSSVKLGEPGVESSQPSYFKPYTSNFTLRRSRQEFDLSGAKGYLRAKRVLGCSSA